MKTLSANKGCYLTQSADVAIQNRVISECLYLPDTADTSIWKEISQTDADNYKSQLDTYNASLVNSNDNSLEDAIEKKIAEIEAYDNSQAVNNFTYSGINSWFNPDERKSYEQSILSCETLGLSEISVPLANTIVKMKVSEAKVMLAKIHLYADACFMVTLQHKQTVSGLKTIADVDSFDITADYPAKLAF